MARPITRQAVIHNESCSRQKNGSQLVAFFSKNLKLMDFDLIFYCSGNSIDRLDDSGRPKNLLGMHACRSSLRVKYVRLLGANQKLVGRQVLERRAK